VSSRSRVPPPRLAADHSRSRAYRLAPSRSLLPNCINFPGCWPGKLMQFGLCVLGHGPGQAYVFGQRRGRWRLQQVGQRLQGD
jgi:hypothetical protein